MSQIINRASQRQPNQQSRRQFLRRMVALAGAVVALGTMREAAADWNSLGGGLTSRPAVGRNQDGRLEVFARGQDGALWQNFQRTNGAWNGWNSLGGIWTGNAGVVTTLDGRLEVFVRAIDNSLYHRWQTTPNGDWNEWWSPLGGYLTSDPTVVRHGDGRLEIFARNFENGVHHRYQGYPSGGWSGWEHFSETFGKVNGNIAAIMYNGSHGINLFWRGFDNRLYWKRQASQNTAWEVTRRLGGPIIVSDPVVAEFKGPSSDYRLVVFVRGADNAIWYRYQMFQNSTTWSNWISLGGVCTGNVAVGANFPDGRLELFVRGANGDAYHTYQTQTDSTGSWTAPVWSYFQGVPLITDPVVAMDRNGRLEVFGIGVDGALWHRSQGTSAGVWN